MEKTELLHLEEIRARYNDNGLSPDEYRAMPISEMARMRMDVKRLLLYIDSILTPSPDNKPLTVGERIRQSDESLAELLASGTPDEPWPHCTICVMHKPGMCTGDTDCKRAVLLSLSCPPEKEA